MPSPSLRSSLHCARLAGVLAISFLLAGCVAAGGGGVGPASPSAPDGSPSPSTPASPSPQPSGSSSASGFYLRAWRTQALAPQYTFSWLPIATISDGKFIDGMVAVPAIYPGPLWVGPSVRTIGAKGIDAIVAEARKQGLLGTRSDFVDAPKAGGILGHIQMVIDGRTYDLVGDPDAVLRCRCIPDPGTSGAFAAFYQRVSDLSGWIPDELGPSSPYEPDRLAVLALPPTQETSGIIPNEVPWPLATPFSTFGTAMGNEAFRCAVVSGANLARLEPVVKRSNQLTRFVDGAKAKDSLQVRVMVPGEPNPCG
jgi:hypothetical protein